MLPDIKNDLMYLLNILESCEKIIIYSKQFKKAEDFFNSKNQLNYNASLTLLMDIGETIIKISNELKKTNQEIEWQKIKDFRNRIAHDYPGLDIFIVYNIVIQEIPKLKQDIIKVLSEGLKLQIFDINEYKVSKKSKFYKNINFKEIY